MTLQERPTLEPTQVLMSDELRANIGQRCAGGKIEWRRPRRAHTEMFFLRNGNVFVFVARPNLPLHQTIDLKIPVEGQPPVEATGQIVARSMHPSARGYVVRPDRPIVLPKPKARPRFLVASANNEFAEVLTLWLEDEGFDVLRVRKAKHATRALKKPDVEFDGVVVDGNLPDATSQRFIKHTRKQFPNLRILAISAPSKQGNLEALISKAGATETFRRPLRENELRAAIRAAA